MRQAGSELDLGESRLLPEWRRRRGAGWRLRLWKHTEGKEQNWTLELKERAKDCRRGGEAQGRWGNARGELRLTKAKQV